MIVCSFNSIWSLKWIPISQLILFLIWDTFHYDIYRGNISYWMLYSRTVNLRLRDAQCDTGNERFDVAIVVHSLGWSWRCAGAPWVTPYDYVDPWRGLRDTLRCTAAMKIVDREGRWHCSPHRHNVKGCALTVTLIWIRSLCACNVNEFFGLRCEMIVRETEKEVNFLSCRVPGLSWLFKDISFCGFQRIHWTRLGVSQIIMS